jgi:OmpA-OmpF porin, OOP family
MKKIIIAVFALALFSSQSLKAEGFYIGLDYLNTKIDTGVTNISSSLDEKDNGYSLYAGMPINENLDIEISYQDFGEASLSGVSGNQFKIGATTYQFNQTATLKASADSYGIAAKPKYKINENVTVYGKLGLHSWDSTFTVSGTTVDGSESADGTDIFYGAGIQANYNNLVARIGYTIYDLDGEDVDSINAGLAYKF